MQENNIRGGLKGSEAESRGETTAIGPPGVRGAVPARDGCEAGSTGGPGGACDVDDLAVGAPGEDVDGIPNAGAVNAFDGSAGVGLDSFSEFLHQGIPEPGDEFGRSLAAANLEKSSHTDLAVGVPGEEPEGGAVNILYGGVGGLSSLISDSWDRSKLPGSGQAGQFGAAVEAR